MFCSLCPSVMQLTNGQESYPHKIFCLDGKIGMPFKMEAVGLSHWKQKFVLRRLPTAAIKANKYWLRDIKHKGWELAEGVVLYHFKDAGLSPVSYFAQLLGAKEWVWWKIMFYPLVKFILVQRGLSGPLYKMCIVSIRIMKQHQKLLLH